MSLHAGHRQRMRDRFLEEGLDGFNDHQVLEMLLFNCVPRKDTNELAHLLLAEFGSLPRVMDAPVEELVKVPGVGSNTAVFLHFAAAFSRYYQVSRTKDHGQIIQDISEFGTYLQPYFIGQTNEVVFLLCLDGKGKVLCCKQVCEGSVNSAGIPVRKVVEMALHANATRVVLAHNHPSGIALPSAEDIETTRTLAAALRGVNVELADHIIFEDNDYVSLVQSQKYSPGVLYRYF